MRIILRENIENLGKKGDIVNVAPGYGRNYLIPKKIAIEVTSRNMKMIEIEKKVLQKGFEKEMASYQEFIDRLNAVTLSFTRKASEKDIIFGSVSATDIRDALVDQGFEVEKKKILLDEPIKRLGNYTVPIKIFHEEKAEVKLEVVKEGEPVIKEEKELEPDLVEKGTAAPESVEEKMERPAVEEKKEETAAPAEEDAQDAPAEVKEAPLDTQEAESGESPEESEVVPEKESVISEESEESPEDVTEIPEETKDIPEEAKEIPKEPQGKIEEDDSQEAAKKD